MKHENRIKELLANGNRVTAVRYVMDNLNMTLADAYRHIQRVERGLDCNGQKPYGK